MSLTTWHKDIKSWRNINQFLFKNEIMSDCSFLVKVGSKITRIPAHKYILGGYSPEFYNLFYLMKASSDEIPIDDVSIENLSLFLELLYTERTALHMNNIGDLFKLAYRYSVEFLKNECCKFLLKNITVDNVLTVMDKYSIYELPNFETECLKIIKSKKKMFEDPLFYEISNQTLTTILRSEELKGFTEIEIFEGTNKWSERFCAKMGQTVNSKNKRLALGCALQYIRFGAMTIPEFSSCSLCENSILTTKEIVDIFQYIGTDRSTVCQYSGAKIGSEIRKIFFHKSPANVTLSTNNYLLDDNIILRFSVNKPIFFYGFEMYGRDTSIAHRNDLFVIELMNRHKVSLMQNTIEVQYDGTQRTYEMLFKDKQLINANEKYLVYIKRLSSKCFQYYEVNAPVDNLNASGDLRFCISNCHNMAASLIYSEY